MQRPLTDLVQREVRIPVTAGSLTGDLAVPSKAKGLVLFAHGSGSSRRSPRNVWVASQLQRVGLATLLFDLLTSAEEERDDRTREHRFDIPLLAGRLIEATEWTTGDRVLQGIPLGYFGASTGSAAALLAAAGGNRRPRAVVSRGGRPDLAGTAALASVTAATLLIVGGNDDVVLDLNRRALSSMNCDKRLEVVPGATHLFAEPGALEQVAALASAWLVEYLIVETAS